MLALNGAQALLFLLAPRHAAVGTLDGFIVLTLPFLVSQHPSPLGGARGRRVALVLWIALLAAWTAHRVGVPMTRFAEPFLHTGPLIVAAVLLALHLVPRTLALPEGQLRTQSLLLGAALGMGIAYTTFASATQFYLEWLARVDAGAVASWPWKVFLAANAAGLFFIVAAIARAAGSQERGPVLFALALGVGVAVAAFDTLRGPGRGTAEFVTQSFRPLLIAVALLRHDVFRLPRPFRRPLARATAALFVMALFVLVAAMLSPQGMGSETLHAQAAMGAFAVMLVGGYAFRRPLFELLMNDGTFGASGERRAHLERYRLALESARTAGGQDGEELRRLRKRLGISSVEHDALEAILDGNLVVPTSALFGAAEGTVVAGRYEVLRELGRGGQGRALLARDRVQRRDVVLKEVLRPWEAGADARRAALAREAAVAARAPSPHLARIEALIEEPWQTYLAREFVPGRTLEEVVRAEGPLPPARALEIVDDVLAGLAALHAAGLLHLDLKPANVVLRPDGRAVIIDQGTARPAVARDPDATRRAGDRRGSDTWSPRWAAPEQLQGEPADARTDLFQAAGVLCYLLTNEAPAPPDGPLLAGAPSAPRLLDVEGLPRALAELLARARSPQPDERPRDAEAMREALRALRAAQAPAVDGLATS